MEMVKQTVSIVQCDMCEQYVNSIVHIVGDKNPMPDNGCELEIHGGYALFHDDYDSRHDMKIQLCHDCTLQLFRSIPKLNKLNGLGFHSVSYNNPNYPLCCEFSWGEKNGETVFGTKENFKPQMTYKFDEEENI